MPPVPPCLYDLTVERLEQPRGVARTRPVFGWKLRSVDSQTGYELEVADDAGTVWSSGRVAAPDGVDIAYGGPDLRSDRSYVWRVRVRTEEGVTDWATSSFETSLLSPDDWVARWLVPHQRRTAPERYTIRDVVDGFTGPPQPPLERLGPPQHVRQTVELTERPVRARLFVSAHGIYEIEVNGRPAGDEVLAPGYDAYHSRLPFQTYDVTDLLITGTNVVGVTVADGWWAGRIGITGSSAQYGDELAVIWQLSVDHADGRRLVVGSGDADAHSARGGHDYADLFIGERYDARAAVLGWSTPGFDATSWQPVRTSTDGREALTPFTGEPVVRTQEIVPSVTALDDRTVLVDVRQVIAGRLRVTVDAPRDTEVHIEHSEVLLPDGTFFRNIIGPNKEQVDVLVCDGTSPLVYEPTFTFHGFRYARISATTPIDVVDVRAVVIGSDLRGTAELETSDERINQLHRNIGWSQRGNFLSIPTDCPQRERAGWTGDFQIFAPAASTNMDVREFAARWLANVRAEQGADGAVPTVVPVIPSMEDGDDVPVVPAAAGWSDAIVLVPWVLWQRYADRRVLEDNVDAMRRWVDYQWAQAQAAVPERLDESRLDPASRARHRTMWNTGWQFGDWLAPSIVRQGLDPITMAAPTLDSELVAAMFHAHTTRVAADVLDVLGRAHDAAELRERAEAIREAFVQEYVSPEGRLPRDLQGHYVLALAFDLLPAGLRGAAIRHLTDLIADADGHLDTGFLSTPYLLDVLWDAGEHQLARDLLWQDSAPSWLYAVDRGATTVWESWDAIREDGTPTTSSFNHYAFGCVDDWIVRRLGGIEPLLPGYARVRVAPDVQGPLTSARARIDTVHGPITSSWTRVENLVRLVVEVPSGVVAELCVGDITEVLPAGRHEREAPLTTHLDARSAAR